jgi:hypothetical protein
VDIHARSADAVRPDVDRRAGRISDPVLRLRFLKANAPPVDGHGRWAWKVRRLGWTLAAACFAASLMLIPALLFSRLRATVTPAPVPARHVTPAIRPDPHPAAEVWVVEKNGELETYSNGLRIDNRFLAETRARSYLAFPADGGAAVRRTEPAGIAFHTTETRQAPFAASENRRLRRIGESLLAYVQRRQAYNFVIDRFGRVFRVVAEDQTANHSGFSTWADEQWMYVNLNESFLAISFETVSPAAEEIDSLTPAQTRSAAMLVEMLRARYAIPATNCVTHAQISVNPDNMLVGLHVDWAAGFPFEAMGLPDNYATALPSLWAYGFDYDPNFTLRAGDHMKLGIEGAEEIVARRAASAGQQPVQYKNTLRRRYRAMLAQVRHAHPRDARPE